MENLELTKEQKAVFWYQLKGIKVRSYESGSIFVIITSEGAPHFGNEYSLELHEEEIEYRAKLWDQHEYLNKIY